MDCICGGKLTITRTEHLPDGAIKRERKCTVTGLPVRTYERKGPYGNNQHEQRLVDIYRELDPPQRDAMWSLLRTFTQERNK